MKENLFTSESVTAGHPDKVADQISDAILDACLAQDPQSKVACETLVSKGLVIIAGEISTEANINYQEIARQTIKDIGYSDPGMGFDHQSCAVMSTVNKQSPDISQGVLEGEGLDKKQGAGDQGMMFGYACNDTSELMPLPIMLSHKLAAELQRLREENSIPYLRPDGKVQVTVEYDSNNHPARIHTIVISTQHKEKVEHEAVVRDMKSMVERIAPKELLDDKTIYHINPTGRFVIGGPAADCGLTGRKVTVDTYGGSARHGGGAFSGKDPSKVDRSAAYAARYLAKNVVAAGLADRCEVQVAYAIGVPHPVSVKVDTFKTGKYSDTTLSEAVINSFDLSPKAIIDTFDLKRPIYKTTACCGHFGRDFPWEKVNLTKTLNEKAMEAHSKEKSLANV